MKKKSILVIGPMPEPTTGVSLANKVLVEGLRNEGSYQTKVINTSFAQFKEDLGKFSLSKFFFYLKQNLYIFKVFSVDIVYITPGQTFFGLIKYYLYFMFTKLLGKELIIHIHGNYVGKEYSLLKGVKKKLFKYLLKKTSKGIVLSESLTGNMSPFISEDKIYVLYNFVEDYLFVEENSIKNKFKNNKPRIIFLSNLMEEKGIFELLDALKILESKGFEYEAKIAGHIDANNKDRIQPYFDELKHTKYCGVVRGSDKKDLLLWGNTFVLPTFYAMEGQPISILEAMATGNIVVTTQHAGIPDVFENEVNGYYVKKQNPQDLADKIIRSKSNSEVCNTMRLHNYNYAKNNYRVENFIKNIINIFNA